MNTFGYGEICRISSDEREELFAFAVHLAERAGEAILPYFRPDSAREALRVDNKLGAALGYDPVTEADREAERIIREMIAARYPGHGVFGEEFGYAPGDGPTWVIDPIDGTRAFVMGLLHWGTLIALFDGQVPVLGVIHQPFLGETFAGLGSRARYRHAGAERTMHTRPCNALSDALCATTSPKMFSSAAQKAGFKHIHDQVRNMRYGTDCYAYAMLAIGQIDMVMEASLEPYDVQALIPVVQGAGGAITTWTGGNAAMGGDILACGDHKLHQTALEEIKSCLN